MVMTSKYIGKKPRVAVTDKERADIIAARKGGMEIAEIAEMLGRNPSVINRALSKAGMTGKLGGNQYRNSSDVYEGLAPAPEDGVTDSQDTILPFPEKDSLKPAYNGTEPTYWPRGVTASLAPTTVPAQTPVGGLLADVRMADEELKNMEALHDMRAVSLTSMRATVDLLLSLENELQVIDRLKESESKLRIEETRAHKLELEVDALKQKLSAREHGFVR